MGNSDNFGWIAIIFLVITALVIMAIRVRNRAAKSDSVGKTEKDSIESSVSIKPRENTRKLD
ncbi:MAG: hypothetical protein AAGC78_12725 [Cellvibrio sp.]|uniref:hypothetical protein n=1 Tax=Cellvibrio sp. TaxID=1965322 RepID=UPI0031B14B8D